HFTEEKTRYRLLETVRQYANYKLVESEREHAVQASHRDYYLAFAIDIRPKLMHADQAHWFSVLDREHDNLRQAKKYCIAQPDGGQYGLKLVGAIIRFWIIRGHFTE